MSATNEVLSAHYNVKVQTHASESRGKIEMVENERGLRNIVYLDHMRLSGPNLVLAHCVCLNEEEKEHKIVKTIDRTLVLKGADRSIKQLLTRL